MKLVHPTFQIIEQSSGIDGIEKQIELAGRTCYKSENKITKDSAKAFVERMIKSGHGAMLEHGSVYLTLDNKDTEICNRYKSNKYTKINVVGDKTYVSTNYRVIIENHWEDDLVFLSDCTRYHESRITVKFILNRVTGESFLRHRVFSFARESTRYCNYSKDKFGNELTFVIPSYSLLVPGTYTEKDLDKTSSEEEYIFLSSSLQCEKDYLRLIERGLKAQQARDILPFSICSPLVMTGFYSDWQHFFDLRCDNAAHPDARYLATSLRNEFEYLGFGIISKNEEHISQCSVSANTSIKNDRKDNKTRWELLPLDCIEDVARVYTEGAKKYGDNNWQNLDNGYERYKGALLRHLYASETNEFDQETGCRHLAQVAWNALAMLWYSKHNKNEQSKN